MLVRVLNKEALVINVFICYRAYMPHQFRPSVHPSVTHMYCIKMAERIIKILSLPDRPNLIGPSF